MIRLRLRLTLAVGALFVAASSLPARAQEQPPIPPWSEPPPPRATPRETPTPRVDLRWDRWYNTDEMYAALREIAAAFPDLVRIDRFGTSVEGREMLVATVTSGGDAGSKPAFWCDGNIHGNEVQGGEACLYLIWWLCENRDLPRVRDLLAERAFYVAPTINPDGRAHWFDAPNTMHSSRSGKRPVDNDRDGAFDEDSPNDIDGDGEILQMRVRDPNGGWRTHPEEPRLLVRAKPGESGEWRLIGEEGLDDDGDGRINEDGPGGYDPNRDWPADWRGPAEQWGAGPYPASLPETRAVIDFVSARPNIAGFQSFHNTGGMILRGPGSKAAGETYPASDDRVLRALAERGEKQLPFYRSMIIWKDLYEVHGGEVNFAYETLGVFAFTNELWSRDQYLQGVNDGDAREARLRFDDDVELGARYVAWKPFEHPTLGAIELGGWRRDTGRVPPPFMIQEMLHRNMAFVLYHASEMPLVRPGKVHVSEAPGRLRWVEATFRNEGMIPTRAAHAALHGIGSPDRATIAGAGLEIVTGGIVESAGDTLSEPEVRHPERLLLERGIGGNSIVRVRWLVRGHGKATIHYEAEKGGSAELTEIL